MKNENSQGISVNAPTIGVAVITYKAQSILRRCLIPLLSSPLSPRILVVNSSSNDGTVELAESLGIETLVVPRHEFNHGLTREIARRHLGTEIVVMMTPDAALESERALENLVRPIWLGHASVAYARQLPRRGAGPIERYNRGFNYPSASCLRSIDDWPAYGAAAHFCSNACAAWSNTALDAIGGFKPTIVSEETVAAATLLGHGHKLAYCADARVVHSHEPGMLRDFKRQFDTGFSRAIFRELLIGRERDEVRGLRYMRGLLTTVRRNNPFFLPRAAAHLAASYLGYRIGLLGPHLPRGLSRLLSSQDFFWESRFLDQTLRQSARP